MQSKTIEFLTFSLVFIPIFIWTILYFSKTTIQKDLWGFYPSHYLPDSHFGKKNLHLIFRQHLFH